MSYYLHQLMVDTTPKALKALDILYKDPTDLGKECATRVLEDSARYIYLLAKDTVDSDVGKLRGSKRGIHLDEEVAASYALLQATMKKANEYLASIGAETALPEEGREHLYQLANNVVTRFYEARTK